MLQQEQLTIHGALFTRNYSDAGFYILQEDTGIKYAEAVDPADNPLGHSYTETDELIDDEETTEDAAYAQAGRILLGEEA